MKSLYNKYVSIKTNTNSFDEPSPPFDLVMRTLDIPNTLALFFRGMEYLKDSIGVPYGPNVEMKGKITIFLRYLTNSTNHC